MPDGYITLDEFLNIAGVQESSVRKRIKEIPGLDHVDGNYIIPVGTRYPGSLRKFKLDSLDDKRYALVKTINQNRYVSHEGLRLYEEQFNTMLNELEQAGLIRNNGTENPYGANRYDTTLKCDEMLQHKKTKVIQEILNCLAEAGGHFAKAFNE